MCLDYIELFTEISPFVLVIVALIAVFLPDVRKWYRRPIFSIEFKNEEPFCRHASMHSNVINESKVLSKK